MLLAGVGCAGSSASDSPFAGRSWQVVLSFSLLLWAVLLALVSLEN